MKRSLANDFEDFIAVAWKVHVLRNGIGVHQATDLPQEGGARIIDHQRLVWYVGEIRNKPLATVSLTQEKAVAVKQLHVV